MKSIAAEWIAKAEGDWNTALREIAAVKAPNFDAVVFHAHQCAEKYLKAALVDRGATFPKTHDLGALLTLLTAYEPELEHFRLRLDALSSVGIEVRYPGASADRADADPSLDTAATLRERLRSSFPSP